MADLIQLFGVALDTRQMQRSARQGQAALQGMGGAATAASRALGPLGLALSAGLVARRIFDVTRATQQYRATLLGVTQSQQRANRAFEELEAFTTRTPFLLDDNVQAFIRLQALGIRPTESLLTDLGNLAAVFGRRMEDIARVVQGLVTGETEAAKSFGIVARVQGEQIALNFNGTTRVVNRSRDEIVRALQDISRQNFAGAMVAQMNTINGQLSNMEDNFDAIARTVGGGAGGPIVAGLRLINEQLTFINRNLSGGGLLDFIRTGLALSPAGLALRGARAGIRAGLGTLVPGPADPGARRGVLGPGGAGGGIGLRGAPAFPFLQAQANLSRLRPRGLTALGGIRAPRGLSTVGIPGAAPNLSALSDTIEIRASAAMARFRRELQGLQVDFERTTRLTPVLGAAIIQTVGGAISSLVGGRGGSFLGAIAGGVAGFLTGGPAGLVAGAIPGLIGALSSRDNRPVEVVDRQLASILERDKERPIIVIRQIVSGQLSDERAIAETLRQVRRGNIFRQPPGSQTVTA